MDLIAMLRNDRITNAFSSTVTWAIMTGIVVIILTFDGVITNLPSYSLQSRHSLTVQLFFVVEVLICVFIQFVYLRIINQKYTVNPTIGHFRKYSDIIYYVVTVTQYIIIALLLLILSEIEILNQYHTIILLIQILLSLFLSAGSFSPSCLSVFTMDKKQTRLSHNCLCCCCYPYKYQFRFYRTFYVVRNARKTHNDTTIRFLD